MLGIQLSPSSSKLWVRVWNVLLIDVTTLLITSLSLHQRMSSRIRHKGKKNAAFKKRKCFDLKYVSKCVLANLLKGGVKCALLLFCFLQDPWQDMFPKPKMKNWAELQIILQVCWKRPTCSGDIKQTHACIYNVSTSFCFIGVHSLGKRESKDGLNHHILCKYKHLTWPLPSKPGLSSPQASKNSNTDTGSLIKSDLCKTFTLVLHSS